MNYSYILCYETRFNFGFIIWIKLKKWLELFLNEYMLSYPWFILTEYQILIIETYKQIYKMKNSILKNIYCTHSGKLLLSNTIERIVVLNYFFITLSFYHCLINFLKLYEWIVFVYCYSVFAMYIFKPNLK